MKPEHHLFSAATPVPAVATLAPSELPHEATNRRRFFRAPQSVGELLAAMLDPAVMLSTLWALHLQSDPSFSRWVTALSLMVIALTYPGRTRLDRSYGALAADIVVNWCGLVVILGLCIVVTRSAGDVDWDVLEKWVLVTPLVHWLAACALRAATRWQALRTSAERTVVVIGADALALRTAQAIGQLDGPRRRVVGYFDDRGEARIAGQAAGLRLGSLSEVARYVDKLGIREVYITLPMASQARMTALLNALQGTTASLFFVPDVLGSHIVQGRLQDLNGLPVVGICETPFTGINELVKRGSDLLVAALLLAASLPAMLLIALAIKLDSPGPVLHRQRRSGLDGEEIIVFKFRTALLPEARRKIQPDGSGPEPQATRVGRYLRQWRLDGLPQLLNVLQGQMSMVGPRPHAVSQNALYRQQIKGYMVRHKARPGITGWAQIHGQAHGQEAGSDTLEAMRLRVAYDLEYLRNWSLGLDLRILARSLRLGLAFARGRAGP